MKELLSDETLTTADLVNPARSAAGVAEPDMAEEAASYPSDRIPSDSVLEERNPEPVAAGNQPAQPNALFPHDELQSFRSQWDKVQTSFVDDPRTAVKQADGLVANVVKRIAEQFASERDQLEKQWDRGEDVNTEDLRQALKRYRAFFDRLLSL